MSLPGHTVLRSIQSEKLKIERALGELQTAEHDNELLLRGLLDRRQECFVSLAKQYLPEFDEDHVSRSIAQVRERLAEILDEKHTTQKALDSRIAVLEKDLEGYETRRIVLTEDLSAIALERDELEKKLEAMLDEDGSYVLQRDKAEQLAQQLINDKRRVDELEDEAEEKLPAFHEEPLFMYLLDKGYGTENYRAMPFVRLCDAWVARIASFTRAKEHYDFLTVVPQLVELEVERRKRCLGARAHISQYSREKRLLSS